MTWRNLGASNGSRSLGPDRIWRCFVLRWWRRVDAAGSDPAAMERVLPGIGELRWNELRSGARPTAAEVPGLLVALASGPDDNAREAIRDELDEHLAPDRLLFEVTPFAVPFLCRLAQDGERPDVAFVAQLILENIAYGEAHADELAAGNTNLMRQVADELGAAAEFLYRQAESHEPRFRAQAVALLAPIDGRSPRFRALLTALDVPAEHRLVVAAVRDAEQFLADVAE